MTKNEEGYAAFLMGYKCYENPYDSPDEDDPSYYLWYDGWMKACAKYPNWEPKDD
jgi:hypothetical protein